VRLRFGSLLFAGSLTLVACAHDPEPSPAPFVLPTPVPRASAAEPEREPERGADAPPHESARVKESSLPDHDHDGVPDDIDACPDVPGDSRGTNARDGCPSTPPPPTQTDRDHDGIVDANDACPDVPGVPRTDPHRNGCP
jgi:hypothetical protein